MLGSWRRLSILKLYGSTFLLKNSNRKEGFAEVIHLYTSSISFEDFFHELSLPPFRAVPRKFSWGVLSLRVPTKMGVADDRGAWPIIFFVFYTMKLWRYGKAC